MIYYYSGTGNTRYAATLIARHLHDRLHFIPSGKSPALEEGESVGFMFPIYSWGVPPIVSRFLHQFKENLAGRYLWAVCTCGDEAGVAMRKLDKQLNEKCGARFALTASVIMPNDYVLLPGFDVDSPQVANAKLDAAPARLEEIAAQIRSGNCGVYDVTQGSLPKLRSAVFPLFKRWGVNPKRWHVSDECISCGACVKACPVANIKLVADENNRGRLHPRWSSNCLSCCACFHSCPARAIDYANFTKGKGQYICPK